MKEKVKTGKTMICVDLCGVNLLFPDNPTGKSDAANCVDAIMRAESRSNSWGDDYTDENISDVRVTVTKVYETTKVEVPDEEQPNDSEGGDE